MSGSRDRLEAILARLAARQADERVFTRLYPESARQAADAADSRRRAGESLGPLDGRIVSIKDLFDVAGEPTTAGSAIRRNAAPAARDAVVVRRLAEAGAVIIGKTAMTEFAFLAVGPNRDSPWPGNAADPDRVPGGSSSGAGVSVAEGTSEIAIGSDTGGSVRIPAALNGVVGFKPTAGRVPLEGAFPLSPTLDSVGPLARDVADCAAADAVMAGERAAAPVPVSLSGLRIGIPRGLLLQDCDPAVELAFERSLDLLRALGAELSECCIDDLIRAMEQATAAGSIASIEGAAVHAEWLRGDASGVDPRVAGPLARRLPLPAHAYIETLRKRASLALAMQERLTGVAVLAMPTVPILAPPAAPLLQEAALYRRAEGLLLRNTQVVNLFDLTAISLPMPGMELPAGLMLVARKGQDRQLLAIAAGVELAFAAGSRASDGAQVHMLRSGT